MEGHGMKWTDLITGADGRLSRTQITIWIAFFLTIGLLLAEVAVERRVLTPPVLGVLCGLHVFALLDRMDARRIDLKLSKDGAEVSMGGKNG
jgi:hypothetical protein